MCFNRPRSICILSETYYHHLNWGYVWGSVVEGSWFLGLVHFWTCLWKEIEFFRRAGQGHAGVGPRELNILLIPYNRGARALAGLRNNSTAGKQANIQTPGLNLVCQSGAQKPALLNTSCDSEFRKISRGKQFEYLKILGKYTRATSFSTGHLNIKFHLSC